MKNLYLIFSSFLLLGLANSLTAQKFIRKESGKPLTFVEMQRQFSEFRRTHDLKNTKSWKYYKRWENDMQYKTNGRGELADPAIFIDEAVRYADSKISKSPSASFTAGTWSPYGPFNLPGNMTGGLEIGMGRINCVAFHPTSSATLFVGVAQGGLWKTTNNGFSWTPLTDNLPILRISDIVIDPANVNTMYISVCDFEYIDVALNIDARKRNTHYGLGVYKTTDGGVSWAPTGLSFQMTDGDASLIRKVLIKPGSSNDLVAAGVSGIYTSNNAGATWTQTLDSLCWDLVQDPLLPNTLYATSGWLAGSNKGYAAVYKSTNFGATWTMLTTGIPGTGVVQRIKLAVAPTDNNYIYAMTVGVDEGSAGIYKSINAGATWTFVDPGVNMMEYDDGFSPGGQGTYDLGFTVSRTDKNTVYLGGINIWKSVDGANTFNPASHWTQFYGNTLHCDIHSIDINPLTNDVFVCSDGGIYRTANVIEQDWATTYGGSPWPTVWTNMTNGMNITSFYKLSSSRNVTDRISAGAQDNATMYYNGFSWLTIFGGDGMDNYLDPLDDNTVLASSQYGNFYISNDGGFSINGATVNVNNESGEWVSPVVADYNIPGTIYCGFENVVKSIDGGFSWFALNPMPPHPVHDNELSALAVANSNSNVLYAARRIRFELGANSTLYTTTNGGTSWTDITAGLPDTLYFTSLDVSQTAANTAFVTLSGFTAGEKVYMTTNGGASWTNISFNLPNVPVNCIKTIPGSNKKIIASDLGVYVLDEATSLWQDASTGLPNVITTDLDFNVVTNKMYVSTFGRGIWVTDLNDFFTSINETTNPEIGISLFPSVNEGIFTIRFDDQSLTNQALDLEIVDITGRIVYSSRLSGKTSYQVQTSLTSGMYFARISGGISGVKSFVVK